MKQKITIVLELKEVQTPYKLKESRNKGSEREYDALKNFFEDIGYKVSSIRMEELQ